MEGTTMARIAILIKYLLPGFVILALGIASTAEAASTTVPGGFPTIQAAIDSPTVINFDTITVGTGLVPTPYTCTGPGNYNVDFKGKSVILESKWGRAYTTIDCQYQGRAFIFKRGESAIVGGLDKGFTIIKGYASDPCWPQSPDDDPCGYGGAIYIKNSTPFITRCEITRCYADAGGGAIFCDVNANATISHCDIGIDYINFNIAGTGFLKATPNDINQLDVNDLHQLGGGIYCRQSSPSIINCNIGFNRSYGAGGGIACVDSDAIIRDCYVWENDAWIDSNGVIEQQIDQHGGGIYIKDCKDSGPIIERGEIVWNAARWSGGGIAIIDSNSRIIGTNPPPPQPYQPVRIWDNHCWASGGGIYSEGNPYDDPNADPNKPPNCTIQYCEIFLNWGYWSGGVSSSYGSFADIDRSTITSNIASWSWLVGGLECYVGGANVTNTIITGNTGIQEITQSGGPALAMCFAGLEIADFGGNSSSINVSYSNIQMSDPLAVWPGEGNINKDPMFVDPLFFDFHLKAGDWEVSPCINAGDPFADYSLEPAPNGGRINIGAYGGTEEATCSDIVRPVPADADADLAVNMVDFAILADNWHLEGTKIKNKKADADNNGIVDERDLFILQKFWLWLQ